MKTRNQNISKATQLMSHSSQRRTCLVGVSAVCLFLNVWPAQAQGIVTTFAGNGNMTFSGDGVPATAAAFNHPRGLAIDSAGGIVSTVAGTGVQGSSGDGGLAINALLNRPISVALDTAGNLYICDSSNHNVRRASA